MDLETKCLRLWAENTITKEDLKAFPEALRVMVERLKEMNNKDKNTISKENKNGRV